MDTGLLHLHNILRWVILVLLIISIARAYVGWKRKKSFSDGDRKVWLFTMITAHITLLVGLYQWLWGRFGLLKVSAPPDGIMKDKTYRFFWVEHPTFMILAIVMITLGYGVAKKKLADDLKYKRALWLFIVALLFILVAIPWPFRDVIGRPWLPGM
jgi:membrane protein DedA with SNARE-associated domain